MRFKVDTEGYGRATKPVYAYACHFPRSKTANSSEMAARGGRSRSQTSREQHMVDVKEVAAYLSKFPSASIHSVALCCFMGDRQAEDIRREVKCQQ